MMHKSRGFTLVELMIVVAVTAALALVAAPSFLDLLQMQRLRGVNAELMSDVQFTRSEAVARNQRVGMLFGGSGTGPARLDCYMVYRGNVSGGIGGLGCDCTQPPGARCPEELRTVQMLRRNGVALEPAGGEPDRFEIDPLSGSTLVRQGDLGIQVATYSARIFGMRRGLLINNVGMSGRPAVCTPDASVGGMPACSPP